MICSCTVRVSPAVTSVELGASNLFVSSWDAMHVIQSQISQPESVYSDSVLARSHYSQTSGMGMEIDR